MESVKSGGEKMNKGANRKMAWEKRRGCKKMEEGWT